MSFTNLAALPALIEVLANQTGPVENLIVAVAGESKIVPVNYYIIIFFIETESANY